MKVIATAKIITARIRLRERPPVLDASVMTTPSCVPARPACGAGRGGFVRDLLAGDPAAVQAGRDPGWQVDSGDRFAGEVLGGKDDQVGARLFTERN